MNQTQYRLRNLLKTPFMIAGLALSLAACSAEESAPAANDSTPSEVAPITELAPFMDDLVMGEKDAPITIIEYASMTCAACGFFHNVVLPDIKKNYVDTGKVRFVFREYPLDNSALQAAMMARCTGEANYYNAIDRLFKSQQDWINYNSTRATTGNLQDIGEEFGLSDDQFDACMEDESLQLRITAKSSQGQARYKITGTPGVVINGELLGGFDYKSISERLDQLLLQAN